MNRTQPSKSGKARHQRIKAVTFRLALATQQPCKQINKTTDVPAMVASGRSSSEARRLAAKLMQLRAERPQRR